MTPRSTTIDRKTNETEISVTLDLDGTGTSDVQTGLGFLDHMLDALARHGRLDLELRCKGDLAVDDHHTAEDCGLALGAAIQEALGDRVGIERFGSAYAPLDEALVEVTIDLSGRPYLVYGMDLPRAKVGTFDVELVKEFYQAFAVKAACNLHVRCLYGTNLHHMIEASFKAFALALRSATRITRPLGTIRSTKEYLDD